MKKFYLFFVLIFLFSFGLVSAGTSSILAKPTDMPTVDKTDDNSNEQLFIMTDKYVYKGQNSIIVYMTINNTVNLQNATIKYNFEGRENLAKLYKFDKKWESAPIETNPYLEEIYVLKPMPGYENECSNITNTSKEYVKKDCIMIDFPTNKFVDISRNNINLKSIGERWSKKQVYTEINEGLNYYKAIIEFPAGTESEFYIEAFGDNGAYGHLDPGISGTTNLTNLLYAYYKLDNNCTDAGDLSKDCTVAGTGFYNTSRKMLGTHSLEFNGATDYFSLPYKITNEDYTVNWWVYWDDTPGGDDIFWSLNSGTVWYLQILNGGRFAWVLRAGSNQKYVNSNELPIDKSGWHMLTFAYDTSKTGLYIDGVLVETQTPLTDSKSPTSGTLYAGRYFGGGYFLKGAYDEVGIWNRSLTDGSCALGNTCGGEIAALYNGGDGNNSWLETETTTTTTTTTTTSTSTTITTTTTLLCGDDQDCYVDCATINTINDTFINKLYNLFFSGNGNVRIKGNMDYHNVSIKSGCTVSIWTAEGGQLG